MEPGLVREMLTEINETFDLGDHPHCLQLARRLKAQLLAGDRPADPLDLGWARFYEFKSLFELGLHRDAWDLLERPEPQSFVLSVRNSAYMFSVGSELAMHLGRPDDVVRMGHRCLELRLQDDDLVSAVQCASTVCELLRRLGRDDANTDFARFLIQTGKETGAERPLMLGVQCLARNIERSRDPRLMREAAACVPLLKGIHADAFLDEALSAIGAVAGSDWYPGVLEEAEPPPA